MEEIKKALHDVCKDLFKVDIEPELLRTSEQFGDYATNIAMQLAKQLNKKPREIAEAIANHVRGQSSHINAVEVAGAGFINITLTDEALWQLAHHEPAKTLKGQIIVAEYSDPNPFKVLHAGHLYTTIIGDAIARLMENAGATVHRLNYGGDVGLHVGKTMWAILQFLGGEHPDKLAGVAENTRLEWLSERYVAGNKAYEGDEKAKAEIIALNKRVYQLHVDQDKSSAFAHIYWTTRQWSYDGFDALYKHLQVSPFEKYMPESDVTPLGIEMVKKGLNEGLFEKSDGAIVFKGEPHDLHTRVFINSDGLPTYEAKDLGLAASKWQEYHFDLSIIITANDIVEYMKVVLKALTHFYPEVVTRSRHLTHGIIKLPGGIKMSSRKGNILRAVDILDAARAANKKIHGKADEEVVLAAVKYAFSKQRIGGDIIYNPNESVSIEGNSGPYLQYAHARARSILGKAQKLTAHSSQLTALDKAERSLLRKIGEYAEVVEKAVDELMPHHVCTYLYELAQNFNSFYEQNRVIGDGREPIRIQLVKSYSDVLKHGLELLGIKAPEKM